MSTNPTDPRRRTSMFMRKSITPAPESRQRTIGSQMINFLSLGILQNEEVTCHICHVALDSNLLSNKKHRCRFCQKIVCKAHSLNKRALMQGDDKKRICDDCDLGMKRDDVHNEYVADIMALTNRVDSLEQQKDRNLRENLELKSILSGLKSQIEVKIAEKAHKDAEFQAQKEDINALVLKAELAKKLLQEAISEKQRKKSEFQAKQLQLEAEMSALQAEVVREQNHKEELWTHLQDLSQKVTSSLVGKFLEPLTCGVCAEKLKEFLHARNHSSTSGEQERSTSLYSVPSSRVQQETPIVPKKPCEIM